MRLVSTIPSDIFNTKNWLTKEQALNVVNNMEKCPECENMTAQANLYTEQLARYYWQCGVVTAVLAMVGVVGIGIVS
jgi:hypothetical protein